MKMKERVVSKLGAVWMTTAVISLILPVFLPSYPNSHDASNVIEAAMVTMFAISFPSSLLGLPLLLFIQFALGIDPSSISGKYFLIIEIFAVGLVQWFRVVPWIFRIREAESLSILCPVPVKLELETGARDFQNIPSREKSPVEAFMDSDR
jgi:hypothetical protein